MSGAVRSTGKAPKRSRSEWHALFTHDRTRGLSGLAIARKHGVSHTFVYSVLADPSGAGDRERKLRYRGTCEKCGGPTEGSEGRAKAPKICVECAPAVYGPVYREARLGKGARIEALLAFLSDGPKRFAQIRDHLGVTSPHTAALLVRHLRSGLVVRVERGLYRLP